ncbi:MAG: sulfite exporter TauE/SafE family protein [Vulcanimicrobiaceae bacterium]
MPPLSLAHIVALAAVALVAGAINSVAGGGSFLSFPTLIFVGVPPIAANATNNTAMWVGVLGSARGYKEEIREHRHLLLLPLLVSLVGSLGGAVLLLKTPPILFQRMIPFLLLFATVVFALSPYFVKPHAASARKHTPLQLALQFCVSVYGGYFGAGMGILMLAILAFSGLPSLNAMNGVKNVLSITINGIAIVPFVIAGIIQWLPAILMAAFAVLGGYFGARFFRRLPARVSRSVVIAIGTAMTAYFFVAR